MAQGVWSVFLVHGEGGGGKKSMKFLYLDTREMRGMWN